jgi:hypothetical protein
LIALLCPLTAAGFFSDRRLIQRYGDAALEATSRTLGIDLALRLAPWLGKRMGLVAGLLLGSIRTFRHAIWPPSFRERMEIFFETVSAFAAASVICIDPASVARAVRLTAPFAVLGQKHIAGFAHDFLVALLTQLSDRPAEARARWQNMIALLESKDGVPDLPAQVRLRYLGGSLYGLGVMEAWREDSEAQPDLVDIRRARGLLDLVHLVGDGAFHAAGDLPHRPGGEVLPGGAAHPGRGGHAHPVHRRTGEVRRA